MIPISPTLLYIGIERQHSLNSLMAKPSHANLRGIDTAIRFLLH